MFKIKVHKSLAMLSCENVPLWWAPHQGTKDAVINLSTLYEIHSMKDKEMVMLWLFKTLVDNLLGEMGLRSIIGPYGLLNSTFKT